LFPLFPPSDKNPSCKTSRSQNQTFIRLGKAT
jgi:hypothetical protein